MADDASVWIFSGAGGRFASGVFSEKDAAVNWIEKWKLSGTLTKYPVDVGVYDWAIARGIFDVKKESERSAEYIQRFTSAGQEHCHFENGIEE